MLAQSITLAAVSLIAVVMTIAFLRLRHRHRLLRHTLTRVAAERDQARWDKGEPKPTSLRMRTNG